MGITLENHETHASLLVGAWYTGQASKFTCTYRDNTTGILTTSTTPFIEVDVGLYQITLNLPLGDYTILIYNSELSVDPFPASVNVIPASGSSLTLAQIENSKVLAKSADIFQNSNDIVRILELLDGKWDFVGNRLTIYAPDQITPIAKYDLFDSNGIPVTVPNSAYIRVPVPV